MPYEYCGSETCSHSKYWSPRDEQPDKFCTQCGSLMITECTNCSKPREEMTDKFCPHCGKAYK